MSTPQHSGDHQATAQTPTALVAFAWALVGVPLVYGLYNTVKAASALFGG